MPALKRLLGALHTCAAHHPAWDWRLGSFGLAVAALTVILSALHDDLSAGLPIAVAVSMSGYARRKRGMHVSGET